MTNSKLHFKYTVQQFMLRSLAEEIKSYITDL